VLRTRVRFRIAPARTAARPSLVASQPCWRPPRDRAPGRPRERAPAHITLAVCLGTIDQIKTAEPRSRAAEEFLCAACDAFAAHDPAFVTLPVQVTALERAFATVTPESFVDSPAVERRLVAVG
jgi:hypothetical protein